jgi:Flp pilus assembly pilin Flp
MGKLQLLRSLAPYLGARLHRGESGASATEYAVIVAIVVGALVLIGGVFTTVLCELWVGMVSTIYTNFLTGSTYTPPDCG